MHFKLPKIFNFLTLKYYCNKNENFSPVSQTFGYSWTNLEDWKMFLKQELGQNVEI
jgi:hypothetical protein